MTPLDTTRFATQSLRRYPLRTSMLLLAIAIGVSAVVMLTAVGEGARRYVTGQFAALGTDLLIVLPGRSETAGTAAGMLVGATARELTLEDTIALKRSRNIVAVAPVIVGAGSASWRGRLRDITVVGTTASMLTIQDWHLQSGRFLPAIAIDTTSPACVLGSTVAAELFARAEPLGQWLRIGDTRCRVTGVLAPQGLSGGFQTDETVIMPVANAQQLFNAAGVFRILVSAVSRGRLEQARADILRIIKARHQGKEDITVITQDAILSTFNSILGAITAALAAIAGISLIVAGILIMNVMLVAVSQRTAEIGLLKALGAKNRAIIGLFLTEAASLSLLGGLTGLVVGTAGTLTLRHFFPALQFQTPAWAAASALAVALASGLVFGIIPARRAARLDPVQALQSN
jgi:putative ABC transport system permease protein